MTEFNKWTPISIATLVHTKARNLLEQLRISVYRHSDGYVQEW
jgi:hypothetical protein